MKKIITTFLSICAFATVSFAQTEANTLPVDFTSKDGDLVITFGGQDLIFGKSEPEVITKKRVILELNRALSFGMNFTPGADNSGMGAHMDYLNYNPIKSGHFDFEPIGLAVKYPSGNYFRFGLNFSVDNYRFNDDITIVNEGGKITAIPVGDVKKSKFKGTYVGIPLAYDIHIGNGFYISPNVCFSLLCKGTTKYKTPKQKDVITGLNDYQATVGLRVTHSGHGFFVNYAPTPIFKDGVGAGANRLSLGFIILG